MRFGMLKGSVLCALAFVFASCGERALVASDTCADWRGASADAKRSYVESQSDAGSGRLSATDIPLLNAYCDNLANTEGQRLPLRRIVQLRPPDG